MKQKLLAVLHWLIVIFIYSAFIWADWRWFLVGIPIYWLQIIIFKACVISIAQYDNKETSFVGLNFNKLLKLLSFKELPMKKIRFFLDWILPIVFLALAYLLQSNFGIKPILQFLV